MKLFSVGLINKTIQILLLFLFMINMGAAFYMPFFSIFVLKSVAGVTLTAIGLSSALYSITRSLIQIPVAKKLDSKPGEKDDFLMLVLGGIFGTVYSFAFLFMHNIWELNSIQIFAGVGDACLMAAYYAIFSHHIDKNSEGFEWSLFSVGGVTMAMAIGGFLGGIIADNFGLPSLFILAGIFNAIASLLLIILYPYVKSFRRTEYYKTIRHEDRLPPK